MPDFDANSRRGENKARACRVVSFALITVLPVLILGYISNHYLHLATTTKVAQYSTAILAQTAERIREKLTRYEDDSIRLFINRRFDDLLKGYIASNFNSERARAEIEAYFSECLMDNRDISALMFVFDADNRRSIVVTRDDSALFADLPSVFLAGSAYENTVKAGGGIVWSSPLPIGRRRHFAVMSRYVKVISSGEPLGVLAVAIDEEQIDRLANEGAYRPLYTAPDEIRNYSIVINDRGEIVSTPFKDDIGRNIAAVMRDVRPLAAIMNPGEDRDSGEEAVQGSYITRVNRVETMVTYTSIGSGSGAGGNSGWRLLNLTFVSHYYTGIRVVGLFTLFLSLGFGLLAVLAASRATSPVQARPPTPPGSQE